MKRLRIRSTDWRGVVAVHPQSAGERFEGEVGQWRCVSDRSGLGIDVATSIPARRVVRFMEQLIEIHWQASRHSLR